MTPTEQQAYLSTLPVADDRAIEHLIETVKQQRDHDHPARGEDLFCLNLTSYMGERMGPVLHRLIEDQVEVEQLRAALAIERRNYDRAVGVIQAQARQLSAAQTLAKRYAAGRTETIAMAQAAADVMAAVRSQRDIATLAGYCTHCGEPLDPAERAQRRAEAGDLHEGMHPEPGQPAAAPIPVGVEGHPVGRAAEEVGR